MKRADARHHDGYDSHGVDFDGDVKIATVE